IRKLTSVSNLVSSRSSILDEVIWLPSFPTNGLLFTTNVICKVGSSILKIGNASGCASGQMVSPILISSNPETATTSPAFASLISTRCNPINPNRSEEHTSELQSRFDLVCRLLLEKKKHNE